MTHPATTRESGVPHAKGTTSAAKDRAPGGLTAKELELTHAYWRACNYLSVGMIYLKDNPLLRRPLQADDVKYRLLGHWGASPALSFVWVHDHTHYAHEHGRDRPEITAWTWPD